jgi:hypothetical protein
MVESVNWGSKNLIRIPQQVSYNGGTPIVGWFIMEYLQKQNDDLGKPPF